ncbi:MAG: PAS domain S-box protein [Armatimonadota bacterium]
MRFLIVDDNPQDREIIIRELRKEYPDSEFVEVYSRPQLDEALAGKGFHVVLTDYRLNWTDGLSVLRAVRQEMPDVPVIMVTDSGSEEVAVEGMRLRLSDYVIKSHLPALRAAVNRALEMDRLRREHEDAVRRLEASERRYRLLVEAADYGIYTLDRNGVILSINRKALEDTWLTAEQVVGRNVADFHDPEVGRQYLEHIRTVVETRQSVVFEHPITFGDRRRWHLDMLYPITAEDGTVLAVGGTSADITDRRQIEQALAESEYRYRILAESSPVAIYIIQDNRYVYANPAALRLAGISWEEAQRIHYLDLVHPDDRERVKAFLESRMAEEAAPERFEIRLLSSEGVRYVDIHATRIQYEGQPAALGVAVDITERKLAEQALAEQRTLLRSVLDAIPDVIYAKDLQSRFIVVNRALAHRYGLQPEDFIGKTDFDLFEPDLAARFRSEELTILESEQALDLGDSLWRHARLGDRWYHTVKIPMRDESGKIVGLIGVGRDVTERRRAEEEYRKLSMVVENADLGLVMLDKDWRIQYVNPAFTTITGYTADEALGQPMSFFCDDAHKDAFRRNAVWRVERGETWDGRALVVRKDGAPRETQAVVFPLRDSSGHVVGYAALYRDITEHLRLEEQFRQAQKMEAIGRLAGGVAHDFNNMLTVILSLGGLLSSRLASVDPSLARFAQQISAAGEKAAVLTQQLLAFSRKQVLEPRIVNLSKLVMEMHEMLRRLIGEDITLLTVCPPDLWPVKVDPGQIHQVILNLAVNARDAMPTGGKLTIETQNVWLDEAYVRTHIETSVGPYVMLSVSDTGHGMDQETMSHLFEPFFTTKERGKGTGLGLSTVYGIVKQSGGTIWAYSEVGRGTTFKIYLPRAEETSVQREQQQVERPVSRGGGGETILVVEDDEMVRGLVANILSANGYEVRSAADPEEAESICRKHAGKIDLLLTDVVMPGMSGRQLVERISELCPRTKVLYMSGYTENAVVHHGVLMDGVEYLQKPFAEETLLAKVRNVLDS